MLETRRNSHHQLEHRKKNPTTLEICSPDGFCGQSSRPTTRAGTSRQDTLRTRRVCSCPLPSLPQTRQLPAQPLLGLRSHTRYEGGREGRHPEGRGGQEPQLQIRDPPWHPVPTLLLPLPVTPMASRAKKNPTVPVSALQSPVECRQAKVKSKSSEVK